MFSFLKPFAWVQIMDPCMALPRPTEIFHSCVDSTAYISRGVDRSEHRHCIFHYTVRGSGEVIYNRKSYRTEPGMGFFNIINDPLSGYGYPADATQPWEFVVICFDGNGTRELVRELLERQVVYSLRGREALFCRLCHDLSQSAPDRNLGLSAMVRLLAMLEPERKEPACVEAFRCVARRDVMKNPTVYAIAAEIGVSREHLHRQFQQSTGMSPARYLCKLRIEMVCKLLREGYSQKETADAMCFPSPSGLSQFFKSQTGITPAQYQQNHGALDVYLP